MKILMVTAKMDTGGAETHIFSLSSALTARGHSVCVVSAGGRLADLLSGSGISHITLPVEAWGFFSAAYSKSRLSRLIKDGSFDIIHAHSRLAAFLCASIAEKYGVPFVTTVHAKFSLSPIYKRLARWGDLSIAVSEDLRHYLCEGYGISSENTRLIENGIDTDAFHPVNRSRHGHKIVFVSRLDKDCSRAAFALCRLCPTLLERFPDLEIIICGGGDAYSELSALCSTLSGMPIKLMGRVNDIGELLMNADLFVGVSRAALEALSCGVTAILGGDEGFFGLVDSEEDMLHASLSNFCCRGDDTLTDKRLFEEICRAFSLSHSERQSIAQRLSQYVRKHHSLNETAEKTEAVYREAMNMRKSKCGKIVLLGYYGFGNLGDNALLRASITRAREKYGDIPISALTHSPKKDSRAFGIRCVNRKNPLSVALELCRADLLVFGGGTLLQDRTSLRSLCYYSALLYFARARGLHIELWGNGIERPDSKFASRLISGAIARAEYIGLRDFASAGEALRLCRISDGDKLYYEKDLASRQAPSSDSRIDFILEKLKIKTENGTKNFAIIAVKGNSPSGYLQILEKELRELKAEGIALVFLPMYPREDCGICHRLARGFGGVVAESVSESDAVGLMKRSVVVYGMRLHSLVFASAAHTPFVGFGGEAKIESFCRENGGLYFTELY